VTQETLDSALFTKVAFSSDISGFLIFVRRQAL
jgi:hypothetical protein